MQLYMEHPLHGRMPVTLGEAKYNEPLGWKLVPALTIEDILKLKGINKSKVESIGDTKNEKSIMPVRETKETSNTKVLSGVPCSDYAKVPQNDTYDTRTANEGQQQKLRGGLSPQGEISKEALHSMSKRGKPDAPRGLQQAIGSSMALQDLSPIDSPEAAYERKFGKAPHHRLKLANIIAALEE